MTREQLDARYWILDTRRTMDENRESSIENGPLLGIVPTALFFLAAFICFRRHLSLWLALCAGFAVWFVAAFIHQWLLNK